MVFVLALISAMTFPSLIFEPSFTFFIKIVSLLISLKAALQKSSPAITPFCFAIILALTFLSLD